MTVDQFNAGKGVRKINLISIIIPVYNTEKYLNKCVDSVLSQTYKNIELILVDDGSTDMSLSICMEYAEKDNRVIVLSKINEGQAAARNLGLKYAKGDYIGFVDSDDWISPNMYEMLMSAMLRHNADITVCGRENVDINGDLLNRLFTFENGFKMYKEDAIKRFLTYDGLDGSSCDKLFKRTVVNNLRYNPELISEDLPFVYNAIKNAETVYHVGEPLYYYYQRQNSTSRAAFNSKSYGMAKYPAEIRKDVYQLFPRLKDEADFYYWFGLINYMKMIEECFIEGETRLDELTIPPLLDVLACKYLSRHTKMVYMTIRMQIYKPIKKLIRRYNNRKNTRRKFE